MQLEPKRSKGALSLDLGTEQSTARWELCFTTFYTFKALFSKLHSIKHIRKSI